MKKRKNPRPVTIYELIIWSYRLPSVRRVLREWIYPRGRECLYTLEVVMGMERHKVGDAAFGVN